MREYVDINCRVVNNNAGGLIETKREKGKKKRNLRVKVEYFVSNIV
jgi:hypothetical protein